MTRRMSMLTLMATLVAVATCIIVGAILVGRTTTAEDPSLIPMSEIVSVVIRGVGKDSIVRPLTKRTNQTYVSFAHMGAHRGTSLPLGELLKASFVDLPLLGTDEARMDPVVCTILRKRKFLPDKPLFTAYVMLRHSHEWSDLNGNGIVDEHELVIETGVLRDMKGQDTGAKIELKMFLTENVRATVEGTEVDAPGKVDVYYKMFTAAFPLVVSKFFVGKSTEMFKKPVGELYTCIISC